MTPSTHFSIQRTLVITTGPLAQQAGDMLGQYLQEQTAPSAAIAVVPCAAEVSDWQKDVNDALIRISPPDLAAQLARAGWRLAEPPEITLILLADVAPRAAQMVQMLLTKGTALIYECLGLETSTLLIWLAADATPEALDDCLAAALSPTRPTLALSLRNEAGLRLPTPAALAQTAAALLWLLTATPLRELPEAATPLQSDAYTGETLICTVGLHSWCWSPATTYQQFLNHWLAELFTHWLARSPGPGNAAQVASWLENNDLTTAGFAAFALMPAEQVLPDFLTAEWAAPWPWQIRHLFAAMKLNEAADETLQADRLQQAELRMDEPLQRGRRLLRTHAQLLLDEHPTAGIAWTCAWLEEAATICQHLYEQLLDQQEAQNVSGDILATERGKLNARLQVWLETWPAPTWHAWLRVALRPWQWPVHVWRYWQLHQAGLRMSQLMTQQAARRRQEATQRATRQAISELERLIWHLHGQVGEIGDMLHTLAEDVEDELPLPIIYTTQLNDEEICTNRLPTPWLLYKRLVADPASEAAAAAAAIGGLGRQLQELDDALLPPLTRLGMKRLAGSAELTTIDALLANLGETSLLDIWRSGWETAAPLWRYDETRLTETARVYHGQQTFVCGAGATMLADLLGDFAHEATWLQSPDRERLFVARVRVGLTPASLSAEWQITLQEQEKE